ncbi:MAG: PQQ-dependent sugar dehydrogenase [Nitrospiraceae bacterium]|nr:MAG: PQQ-dependent sugar dehydrogenase [Nitrospiraceae bacterium]
MKKIICVIFIAHLLATAPACSLTTGGKPQAVEDVFLPDGDAIKVEVWVENLEVPWSLVFLSEGRALVSERGGAIRLIRNGKLQPKPYAAINVAHTGEAGLMGLAVHPRYPQSPYVYAMHTYKKGGKLYNRVIRLKDEGETGAFDRVLIDDIPGGTHHDGGRIAFGPDGLLYITTGETFEAGLAQDLRSFAGKILRTTPEGDIPQDNPFRGSPVYSYGHRNPQGIAWHPATKKLFASEHGPSGEFGRFANDEINSIVRGGNYGWPDAIGAPGSGKYLDPVIVWKKTTPPSGITFYRGNLLQHVKGDLFVATLKSEALIRIRFDKDAEKPVRIERWFVKDFDNGKYGRLRDVVEGPDGALYFLTSNRDGRGTPASGDDRIYRITPQ